MRPCLVLAVLLFCTCGSTGDHRHHGAGPCDDARTQGEMTRCFAGLAERNERALDDEYESLLARLDRPETQDVLALIEDGQAKWTSYRDGHCAALSALWKGGSMRPMQEAACRAMLAEQRRATLRTVAVDRGLD